MLYEIIGVVPARGGSKQIPRKNLLTLGGRSLLELAIGSSLESKLVTRTLCSTEDPELAREARRCGAEVPFMRSQELATDTAGTWPVLRDALEWLGQHEGYRPDIIVALQPTTPFRTGEHIDQTIQCLLTTGARSTMTVRPVDYPAQWMFWRSDDGTLTRLFPGGADLDRRQDARIAYQPNGLVYAAWSDVVLDGGKVPTDDCISVTMGWPESINIDELWQYKLAQCLWES